MGSKDGSTYDDSSVDSIREYAKLLCGKSLDEATDVPRATLLSRGKGGLGVLVETEFFDLPKSNKPTPDFESVGLELKTTPLNNLVRKGLQAKENLKLTSLNPSEVDKETWATSRVVTKCGFMLVVTYLHDDSKKPIDMEFTDIQKVINLLDANQVDAAQFRRDWETIQSFIHDGKGHELSSGVTLYLIANTSGAGHGKGMQEQPHSTVRMKPRSFMIKRSYLNHLLLGDGKPNILLTSPEATLEESLLTKLKPYLGRAVKELAKLTNYFGSSKTNKGYYRGLLSRLLGARGVDIPEFEKSGIKIKTIRLNRNGRMREEVSFKNFKYQEIVNEDWDDSIFREEIESKFLFVVFRETADGLEILEKVGFWDMPFVDREEARKTWEETKRRVARNNYQLPSISETKVAHVRPHGRNKDDKYPTPQGGYEAKRGFWLNRQYLQGVIDSL